MTKNPSSLFRHLSSTPVKIDSHNPILWVSVLTLGIVGAMIYSLYMWFSMTERYTPMVIALTEIKLEATSAHLWFEEIISGDPFIKIEDVWQHLDRAEWYAHAMLEGGEDHNGRFVPLKSPVLRHEIEKVIEGINAFRSIAKARLEPQSLSGVGTDMDQVLDKIFIDFLILADAVEKALQQTMKSQFQAFRVLQILLLTIIMILGARVGFLLMRHERRHENNLRILQSKEEKLRKSENQLTNVITGASLGYWDWQYQTGDQDVNDRWLEILGLERSDIVNNVSDWEERIHPDDKERVERIVEEAIQSGKTYVAEFRMKHKNGHWVWIQGSGAVVLYDPVTNEPQRFCGTHLDVSERKLAEEALRDNEERLQYAQRIAHMGFWDWNIIEDRLFWSDEQYRIFGIDPPKEGASYETFFNAVYPDDREFVQKHVDAALNDGCDYNIDYRIVLPDGEIKYIHAQGEVQHDTNGDAVRFAGTILDITERKAAEEKLYESEQNYLAKYKEAEMARMELADFFENATIGMHWVGPDGIILWVNQHELDLLGYTHEEYVGHHISEFHADQEVVNDILERLGKKKILHDYAVRLICKDGSFKDVLIDSSVLWEGDEFIHIRYFTRDVTEKKKAEEELQKLSRAVEYSSSAVCVTDIDGNIEYINPKFTEITGYTREEAIGENPRLLNSEETPNKVYAELWETITSGGHWKGELHNRKKDGSLYWARNSISGVKNANGDITNFIAIQEDVTHEYELSEQLSYQASHDSLTSLVNRREFERQAERLITTVRKTNSNHALCYIDLDQFKVINDTCGHVAGDELLRQISAVLKDVVRKRDTLARLGGDEFGVLMEHCTLDGAHRVATSLQQAIQDYQFSWQGQSFRIGVSMGLVAITSDTHSLTDLLREADAACYVAKDAGRNRIHVYHADDSDTSQRHGEMQWVARLQCALDEDRFCLYAQAIVPLDGGTDKHYELLLRMVDKKGKTIPPGAFLPAAERYNLITTIDRWVVKKSFDLLTYNPVFLKQVEYIAINLSGQSITEPDFMDFIVTQLDESGLEGNKICFEITETAAISSLSMAIKFISTLKGLGCRFALDDFGSGLSSFGYLKTLPVDYLKIDGMFVKDIVDDLIDHAMVKAINEVGHIMGMQTIAEFVENDVIKGMLKEIGVNHAQGYGIAKPVPFDELLGPDSTSKIASVVRSLKLES